MVMVLALAAALLYGGADFLGGAATRRAHVLSVTALSATAGLSVLLIAALASGDLPRAGRGGLGPVRGGDRRSRRSCSTSAWPPGR